MRYFSRAVLDFSEVVKSSVDSKTDWNMMALCRGQLGEPEAAEEAYRQALAIDPSFKVLRGHQRILCILCPLLRESYWAGSLDEMFATVIVKPSPQSRSMGVRCWGDAPEGFPLPAFVVVDGSSLVQTFLSLRLHRVASIQPGTQRATPPESTL